MIANTVKEVLVELLEELKPKSNAKEVMNAKEVGQYLNMSESWVRQEKMNGLPHFYLETSYCSIKKISISGD